jgi:hypothetical protein
VSKSKFDGLFAVKGKGAKKGTSVQADDSPTESSPRKGKRNDPAYTQISAYIRKDTHRAVMQEIVTKRDLSDLIEELFTEWLKKQK